jgi:GTP pyrophosphokinase
MSSSLANLFTIISQHGQPIVRSRVSKAYHFAKQAHQGQIRHTGEPLISHPLETAKILASWGQSESVIIAALLHETLELGNITPEQIKQQFGSDIATLVERVTQVGQVKLRHSTNSIFLENARKMFFALAQDIRVIFIRLADRLHNMQTLDAIPIKKQRRIALETLEVYAPLAERLGMGHLKGELEDLAFPFIYPKEALWLDKIAAPHFRHAQHRLQKQLVKLNKIISKAGITAQVHGRPKHRYSLYKKLIRPEINKDINSIHDLIALRIITNTESDCYSCLGLIHKHFKPAPHLGISDYIAQPKPNGYQSIHTRVFDSHGHIIEIQIRTQSMHEHAEYGAAAHHAYAEAKAHGTSGSQLENLDTHKLIKKMDWVHQLSRWQKELSSASDFVTSVKLDALSHRIYVFSPLGDVYDLPVDATPIDFAFAVHTNLINQIQAAKVNGRLVSLSHPLKSGDLVEIIKSKYPRKPSKNWLSFVKTHRARTRITKILQNKDSQV